MSDDETRSKITLAQLKVLHAVMETNSAAAAARLLGVSAALVSQQVKRAQRALGVPFLVSDGQDFKATSEGQLIRSAVDSVIKALESLEQLASQVREAPGGMVSIGALPHEASRVAVPATIRFRADSPSTKVRVRILPHESILKAIELGEIDFGLTYLTLGARKLRFEDFDEQTMVCIAPRGHKFSDLVTVSANDLAREVWISLESNSALDFWLEDELARAGIKLATAVEVSTPAMLVETVTLGGGVGLIASGELPKDVAANLVVRPFEPEKKLKAGILFNPNRVLSSQAERWLKCYRSEAAKLNGNYYTNFLAKTHKTTKNNSLAPKEHFGLKPSGDLPRGLNF